MPRIAADRRACTGHAVCVAMADDVFDIDDHGIVVLLREVVEETDAARVTAAVRSCPRTALRLEAAVGRDGDQPFE
jgi:ferredoxin